MPRISSSQTNLFDTLNVQTAKKTITEFKTLAQEVKRPMFEHISINNIDEAEQIAQEGNTHPQFISALKYLEQHAPDRIPLQFCRMA